MTAGRHVLVVRLDSLGDMLICGPAIRAVAASADRVTVLAGPRGAEAARLLPGVDDVLVWDCPWIAAAPPPVDRAELDALAGQLAAARVDEALVLTSFHQSALPTALLLRLAGIGRIAAVSEDYPGALLDVRVAPPGDAPEPVRMLQVAAAAGYRLPPGDDGRLRIRPDRVPASIVSAPGLAVVHPGADAPARAYPAESWREVVRLLTAEGRTVAVTGSSDECELTRHVAAAAEAPGRALDLGGRLDLPALAAILRAAAVVLVANTGPAHLAAAVGTPVVSLFAPVVPAARWAPYGVPTVVLGDQSAACAGSRARNCPVPGHPCLADIPAAAVVAAADRLSGRVRQEVTV
jgi:ADP-heptose:LPS heptosyltransferase